MDAKKCDRCKSYYDFYCKNASGDITNGVQTVHKNDADMIFIRKTFELCPKCRDEFNNWINMRE